MLKEYAIEPIVIDSYKNARYWLDFFGLDKGRQISRFPKKWKALVMDNVKGFNEKGYIRERLKNMDSNVFRRGGRSWDNSLSWSENALQEYERKEFQAIIVKNNDQKKDNLLVADEVDQTHPKLKLEYQIPIQRDLDGITKWVRPLIEQVNEIAFVDMYFQPQKPEYLEPLKRFFKILSEKTNQTNTCQIHFVCGLEKTGEIKWFKEQCHKFIKPILPLKSRAMIHRIKKEENHNRYILTESHCGVLYGHAIAKASKEQAKDDEITIYNPEINKKRWEKFITNSGEPDFIIEK